MDKKAQYNFWYFIVALGLIILFQTWWGAGQQVARIPYSEFLAALEAGQIERVAVSQNFIEGKFAAPRTPNGPVFFSTTRVESDVAAMLAQYDVVFDGEIESNFLANLLSWLLPMGLLIGFWWFMFRGIANRQGGLGGMLSIGKSKAKVYVESDTGVDFGDVAGVDEAKAELEETVNFLKDPERYGRLGARQPKGILLVGPPGTGKTLLARAVAGEAGVPFYSINGSEFVEMFVGVGAARVRDLFEQARTHAPCIIFIDELDALGRARGGPGTGMGGHDEKEQTLNQLLSEMDGFDPRKGVIILSATNRPEILDPALLRAGRFDRQVLVDRPDKTGRLAILRVHAAKIEMSPEADLEQVASLTAGFTGADLANLVNEAAIVATRRDAESVTLDDFTAAIERIVAGLEKRSRLLNETERKTVAYHELGHAIVASLLPGVDPVHKVSIIPRGIGALGYTIQRPTEDRYLMSKRELENKMAVLFGGRAAETVVFGHVTTGASDDIEKATEIARAMVTQFGMDEEVGQVTYESPRRGFLDEQLMPRRAFADETARAIDRAVRDALDTAFQRAAAILSANRAILDRAAEKLLVTETLDQDALNAALEGARLPTEEAG